MARYYGFYSNVSRGKRKKVEQDEDIPQIIESKRSKEFRKNWARLIQKIYEVDPLVCPKCQGTMKVIAVIEDEDVVKTILFHLDLWEQKTRPPPKKSKGNLKYLEPALDYSDSQVPISEEHLYVDPIYPEI